MNKLGQADGEKWQDLVGIMARLRQQDGCPWDREQTHQSLKKYFLEETYEVLDAIDAADDEALCDELGDALLQVVFHAQIAAEENRFTIDDVVEGICQKMRRRHPHVFDNGYAGDSGQVLTQWEEIKAAEKASNHKDKKRGLMYVNDNLPALLLAQKVQDKAARVGFDWPDISGPREKVNEELVELDQAANPQHIKEELGDCLFALVNLARFYQVDAEDALRSSAHKFMKRFTYIEEALSRQNKTWQEMDLPGLDQLWQEAKTKE